MKRGDVGLAIAAGVLLMLAGSFTAIGAVVFEPALQFWYVGMALAIVLFLGRRRGAGSPVARGLGFVAVAWVASATSWYILLVGLIVAIGPIGP